MEGDIATFEIEDLAQGKEFSFEKKISSSDVDMFARLTGDNSPIHMEDSFAQKRGFKSRVVHGGLLVGCISQLVGVYFPGENSVIQTLDIKFSHPAYIGDILKIYSIIDQVSESMRTIILKLTITNQKTGQVLLKSKVQVGFTKL
jgi:3-hydroxybutyryl-CoA dehydratase